jgi:Flp pilus assembly protein TadB
VRTYTRSDKLAIFVGKYFCVVGVVCLLLFAMYFVIYKATKMVQLNKQFLEDRAVLKREKCEEILKKAEEEASKLEPYGKVYTEGLKQHTKWALFYNVFFLLRVVIFVLIAFLLSGYAVVQVIIVSCMSLAMLVYLIRVRPFEEDKENVMAIINETGNLFMALSIYAFAGNYSTSK